jgi:hypothetical protein
MLNRYQFAGLGVICLFLTFTGCTATAIDAITVTPTQTNFEGSVGGTVQLTAIATIGHGAHPSSYEDVTNVVKWSTPLTQVANVSSTGYVTMVGYGSTQIVATTNGFGGVVSGSATVCGEATGASTCSGAAAAEQPKTQLSLVKGARSAATPGATVQFRVMGTARETGIREEMTDRVIWSSTDESVATVSNTGLVTAVGRGSATIMALMKNEDRTAVATATKFTVGEEQ